MTETLAVGPVVLLNAFLCLLLAFLAVLLNGFLLLVLYKNPLKCLRTPTMYSIISLSVSDFLTGLVVIPCYSAYYFKLHSTGKYDDELFHQADNLSYLTLNAGIVTVEFVCMERFLAVKYPIKYRVYSRNGIMIAVNVGIWVYSAAFGAVLYTDAVYDMGWVFFYVDISLHFILPAIILPTVYIAMFREFKKQRTSAIALQDGQILQPRDDLKKQKQMAVTFMFIIILFYVTWIPYYATLIVTLQCESCKESSVFVFLEHFSLPVCFSNCFINPCLYAWKIPTYRRSFKVMLLNLKGVRIRRPHGYKVKSANNSTTVSNIGVLILGKLNGNDNNPSS